MPRPSREGNSSQEAKEGRKVPPKTSPDGKICIVNEEAVRPSAGVGEEEARPALCKLRHPRLDSGVMHLISADCTSIYQLSSFQEKFRSWFFGDTVHSDGQMVITTRQDPLFLILPYLINAGQSRFMTLDQLIYDENFPECHKLLTCCNHDQLDLLCDWREMDDNFQVYRYSKEKTLAWLKAKVESVADALENKQISVNSKGSHSAIFVRGKNTTISRESFLEYAHGIVSDYLPVTMETELRDILQLPEPTVSTPTSLENEPPLKKAKLAADADITPTEDYSRDVKKDKSKTGKLTAAQKKLSKVDKSGMKSISSFFSAK